MFIFNWILAARMKKADDKEGLSRLKSLLAVGFRRESWTFDFVLEAAKSHLSADDFPFYRALADAILDAAKMGELDGFDRWKSVEPKDFAAPWDMAIG